MNSILLIDDDFELGELLQEYLSMEGFQLTAVQDGETGLIEALSGKYNLILLDVMLPKLNGFEVLRKLRAESNVPVIMLTARGESVDRVLGLEHGADDYIPKPYHHHELVARIKALFRRIELSNCLCKGIASRIIFYRIRGLKCGSGEIGRHAGFRFQCRKA